MRTQRLLRWIAALVVLGILVGLGYHVIAGGGQTTITGYFARSTGLYTGDDVRLLGVKVGSVDSIEPQPDDVKITFHVDSGIDLPADVKAAIVAQNLVTSRFIQLAPAYTGGPKLASGAVIPEQRTAVPLEWDDLKAQLTRLAKSLAPTAVDTRGALSDAVGTADANLTGSAAQLRSMLHNLSEASGTLAASRGDLFGTVSDLQQIVSTLVASDASVRSFSTQLNAVSGLLADNRTQLGTALDELDGAVGKLTSFTKDNRGALKGSLGSLSTLVQTLTAKQYQLAELLHVAPVALDNFYNIVDPRYHAATGTIAAANFGDVAQLVCRAVVSTGGTVDTCLKLLTPLLKELGIDTIPTSVKQAAVDAVVGAPPATAPSGTSTTRKPDPISSAAGGLLGLLLPGGGT
jgi:phospholipid/cholesterol/gamma-HCH transport system substrate-binding protein